MVPFVYGIQRYRSLLLPTQDGPYEPGLLCPSGYLNDLQQFYAAGGSCRRAGPAAGSSGIQSGAVWRKRAEIGERYLQLLL